MAQVESIDNILTKKGLTPQQGTIRHLWKIIDPENKFSYDTCTEEWYRLSLDEQRKLYLYLLYRKWQGEQFFGTPYDIVTKCHPYPTNWNGRPGVNSLMKSPTKMVIAKFDGYYGTFTLDEAKVWEMTDLKPLNF